MKIKILTNKSNCINKSPPRPKTTPMLPVNSFLFYASPTPATFHFFINKNKAKNYFMIYKRGEKN